MELGIYTFVESMSDAVTGEKISDHQRIANLMEEIELADQLGLDVFGIGEHHRHEFLASSPAILLAAAAVKTNQIKLTSTVTVLSSDDPVRVFQQFATIDLLSKGRAEIMAGRGSFIESFPLFGYDLNDYNVLFTEKLELLLKLNESEVVSWQGKHRPSFQNLRHLSAALSQNANLDCGRWNTRIHCPRRQAGLASWLLPLLAERPTVLCRM